MNLHIYAGMRVLYKHNHQWTVGELAEGQAEINHNGLYFMIIPKEFIGQEHIPLLHNAEMKDIYFDSFPLDEWVKEQPQYFMTKEQYIKFLNSDDFNQARENAFVSDGEYGYYPVSKYHTNWINKQPFDYIVRGE